MFQIYELIITVKDPKFTFGSFWNLSKLCKMFSRRLLKPKGTNKSLPTAWELSIHFSSNPIDLINEFLIKDFCPLNTELEILIPDEPNEFRFSIASRTFPGENSIFLHCEIFVCQNCQQEDYCDQSSRNRRSGGLKTSFVHLGPIYF